MNRSYWGDPSIGIDRLEKMRSFSQGQTTNVTVDMSKEVIELKFISTHEDAVLPVANNSEPGTGDTGYDLTAVEDIRILPNASRVVPVGLKLAYITPGFWFRIEPRSGLGFKKSVQPHLGVIDNGYRGDMGVKLYNFHDFNDVQIRKGDKIAQIVVYELLQPTVSWAEEVSESARGEKGFGSSDEELDYDPVKGDKGVK
jgi:dUTP pyrophosphatase